MKKYYFVYFLVFLIKDNQRMEHMSVISTNKEFFPIIEVKEMIRDTFESETGNPVNIIIQNFIEVTKDSFDEFHKGNPQKFSELI